MAAGDLDLLAFGVAGNADDFHAIHQRAWNVQRIGGCHEHHIRQVVIDFQIMVVEGRVLLGIEHLEQRG